MNFHPPWRGCAARVTFLKQLTPSIWLILNNDGAAIAGARWN